MLKTHVLQKSRVKIFIKTKITFNFRAVCYFLSSSFKKLHNFEITKKKKIKTNNYPL